MKKSLTLIAVVVLLVVLSTVLLAACISSDPAKAKESYEKAGYTVLMADTTSGVGGAIKNLIGIVDDTTNHVVKVLTVSNSKYAGTITYYDDNDTAKKVYKSAKENAGEDTYVKRDGKAVFVGDKEAYNKKKAD
jgi:regulator of RNase E activity RraB